MFRYYLKLGLFSIRKNPVLSSLMVAAIAVGIGACMTILNIDYVMSGNPIPHRSDVLYHVQVDSWDPNDPYEDPDLPPEQVTYLDGHALWQAQAARRQVLSYKSSRVVQPAGDDERPFAALTRSTTSDFFAMFDTPFLYGGGWDASADNNEDYVVVIGREVNERVFGGRDSVGETIVLNNQPYRVMGVMDAWEPLPKFYDVNNGPFEEVEELFIPFSVSIANEMGSAGNTSCWKPAEGGWEGRLASECIWMQLWVELHGEREKEAYLAFLDGYAESQKAAGRFPRPVNNRLNNVTEWMDDREVVAEDVNVLLGIAVLFLIVCLLNTIGLLLAKVARRTGDISLRRALGASRRAVFAQYIVEAGMIGAAGGVLGIGMTWLGLQGIRGLYGELDFIARLVAMDWPIIFMAVGLAIVAALAAALYPTWRACRVHPASQLKAL
ncbi:MAG: ABC transporter permease [Woeseiaceae bacterium]|nr:ABC transporter permease [Woeseiaceae bacterium]